MEFQRCVFLKEFDYAREMQKLFTRFEFEEDEEYEKRTRYGKYGIVGEELVAYELKNIFSPIVSLYNIRIIYKNVSAQADFIIIIDDIVVIVEVKNLLGNIKILKDNTVIRIINKHGREEEYGMVSPIIQINKQSNIFRNYFEEKGFKVRVVGIVVMANPKTIIYNDSNNADIIKYDMLSSFLNKYIKDIQENFGRAINIGKTLMKDHVDYDFSSFHYIGKKMEQERILPSMLSGVQKSLYEQLLLFRKTLSKELKIPICNLFTNAEAMTIVNKMPKNKIEFLGMSGFKEKKYNLFGEKVIDFLKKY